jgi:hypothetical protein
MHEEETYALSREKESSRSATVALFASISAGLFEVVAKLQQTFTSSAKHANLPCASVEPSSSVLGSRQIRRSTLRALTLDALLKRLQSPVSGEYSETT